MIVTWYAHLGRDHTWGAHEWWHTPHTTTETVPRADTLRAFVRTHANSPLIQERTHVTIDVSLTRAVMNCTRMKRKIDADVPGTKEEGFTQRMNRV